MSISIELLATIISATLLTLTFIFTRVREAETRGRLLQRIDQIEKDVKEAHGKSRELSEKIVFHDGELIKITATLQNMQEIIEKMDKKIDRMLDRG